MQNMGTEGRYNLGTAWSRIDPKIVCEIEWMEKLGVL